MLRYLFKISYFRAFICLFRYFFFFYKFKFIKEDNEVAKNFAINYEKNAIISDEKLSIKKIILLFKSFKNQRSTWLLNPLSSLIFLKKEDAKILSIGPRFESEIFNIRSYGFKSKNIKAIDLHSYSPLIDIGDIHNIKYENNSFDLLICGWVLRYSTDRDKAISEMIRVTKNGGIIAIGVSFNNQEDIHPTTISILNKISKNVKKVYFNIDPTDFPEDHKKKYSLLIFSVNK